MNRITAIVRNGKIELLEPIDLPEGTQLTILVSSRGYANAIEYDLGLEAWTQEEWTNLSLQGLNRAYGDDEPDYENLESKDSKPVI